MELSPFQQAIQPLYSLFYLICSIGAVRILNEIIYRHNLKLLGRRQAYGTGDIATLPLYLIVIAAWAYFNLF